MPDLCQRFFSSIFSFFKIITINENLIYTDYASGIRLPDCSKLTINCNDVTIYRHDVIVELFWRCLISLVNFSYWSKFHVIMITVSGVMIIFFYIGLNRNTEIGNIPVWVLPNIWRLGRVRTTKFVTKISTEMLLNAAKWQSYSFYRFWVTKRKPTGDKVTPPPSRLI